MLYNHFTEIAFYIYFLICNKTKNKQLPINNCLHSISQFNSLPQLLTKSHYIRADTRKANITRRSRISLHSNTTRRKANITEKSDCKIQSLFLCDCATK